MLQKTQKIRERFDELTELVSKPEIIADMPTWKKLVKERSSIEDIALAHEKLSKTIKEKADVEEMLKIESDHEMIEMLEEERQSLFELEKQLNEEMKILLLPKDENDDKNVIMEIRGGAGGERNSALL